MLVRLLMVLGAVAAFLLLLALAGLVYQVVSSARDARKYPAPGRMVDVGGHRLHIYCLGVGSPTVVMDSGLPGSSLSWSLVQPEVARFARVCSYDRAGLGWSDPGPTPRTTQQIVAELHTLLANAGVKPPYVLVGHSFGAFTARRYAAEYPTEVAGIVLVDPADPGEWLQITAEQKKTLEGGVKVCRRAAIFARLGIARLVWRLLRAGAAGVAGRFVTFASDGAIKAESSMFAPLSRLPAEMRPLIVVFWTQPKFYEAVASQVEYLPQSAAQVASTSGFGDIPLVVLSASNPSPDRLLELEAAAHLSSNGKLVIASKSGHWIPLDQPSAVTDAVREVVESARQIRSPRRE